MTQFGVQVNLTTFPYRHRTVANMYAKGNPMKFKTELDGDRQ